MLKLKNLFIIGGVAIIAVLGILITRAIAAPAPWEQTWPANAVQTQTQVSQQPPSTISPSTSSPSNSPSSQTVSSSSGVSAIASTNAIQSTKPVKSNVSSSTPATSTNKASSSQSVSTQVITPPQGGQAATRNRSGSGYWSGPIGQNYNSSYSWYSSNGMNDWNGSGAYEHR